MYDQLEASLHDVFWDAEGMSAELPLVESFLQRFPGTALELGCGSGRLLLPLLENGYLIEGLDNSSDMLALCRQKAGACEPILHHADMTDFQTGSIYGGITIPAFTLQLLPPESLPAVFSNINNHLHPGGGLYFTTFVPWAEITGELDEGEWFLDQETNLADGRKAQCYTQFEIKRLSQQLTRQHRYKIIRGDKTLESSNSTHHLTWYWPREIIGLLRDTGFSVAQMIGDFSSEQPMDDNSQIITVIALRDEGD